jgi:excinuclease ABC subunit A
MFNNPESACRTCGGLGSTSSRTRSCWSPIRAQHRGGCFVREAFKYNPDTWDGR